MTSVLHQTEICCAVRKTCLLCATCQLQVWICEFVGSCVSMTRIIDLPWLQLKGCFVFFIRILDMTGEFVCVVCMFFCLSFCVFCVGVLHVCSVDGVFLRVVFFFDSVGASS